MVVGSAESHTASMNQNSGLLPANPVHLSSLTVTTLVNGSLLPSLLWGPQASC